MYAYQDVGINFSQYKTVVIEVQSCGEVMISLTNSVYLYTANFMYEVLIGGHYNIRSAVR